MASMSAKIIVVIRYALITKKASTSPNLVLNVPPPSGKELLAKQLRPGVNQSSAIIYKSHLYLIIKFFYFLILLNITQATKQTLHHLYLNPKPG